VNYPSTEYLQLPFLDFAAFNVYLESPERLDAYLARLQNLTGDRPLVLAEIGLDSRRHGEERQADVLDWQIRTAFAAGCAGAFVFAWTDEWHRGGFDIDDWDFGLTDRHRRPKPAMAAVGRAMAEVPFPENVPWPGVSVVVCTHNGARTLHDCCEGLRALDYPDFEVIVVDDGSTDATAEIAQTYGFQVIRSEHKGLSHARNTGLAAARGEIVAYTDDDARPDSHWLRYLAAGFLRDDVAGLGGPNLCPLDDGFVAECVASAPGGPAHVLLTDREAEHVPGCNMAFRRETLQAIGGFDPRFRAAGDDVDVCWRLADRGLRIGFSAAAVVWHHRRNSVRAYWRQQRGYGRAESLLEAKWPEKYNAAGHVSWAGRVYGSSLVHLVWRRNLIYQGVWGRGLFQSIYQPRAGLLDSLPSVPEWYLLLGLLALLGSLGTFWPPLLLSWLLLGLACALSVGQAVVAATHALNARPGRPLPQRRRFAFLSVVGLLFLIQPLARLCGRLEHGLSPWRLRGSRPLAWPRSRTMSAWYERWRPSEERLGALERAIRDQGVVVRRGGDFDPWDLEVRGSLLGGVRVLCAIEEHGGGKQLLRVRAWPRYSVLGSALALGSAGLALTAALEDAWPASAALAFLAGVIIWRMLRESAIGTVIRATERLEAE
jgi:GT2 family glycosyltransferase